MSTNDAARQEILDTEHLRLLVIVHYIRAGMMAFFLFIPVVYLIMGLVMTVFLSHIEPKPGEPPPAVIGGILVAFGFVGVLFVAGFAFLQYLTGRFLSRRTHRLFCVVVSALNCLGVPYGTAIGAMSLIVLSRESVRMKFAPTDGQASAGTPPEAVPPE